MNGWDNDIAPVVLFDGNTLPGNVLSDVFVVPVGYVAVLSGFNFPGEIEDDPELTGQQHGALVNKVWYSPADFPQFKKGCTDFVLPRDQVTQHECVTFTNDRCSVDGYCNMMLTGYTNTLALTIPGAYTVELTDDTLVGEVHLNVTFLTVEQAALFPKDLILGNR